MSPFLQTLETTIAEHDLLKHGQRVVVALSGGSDSVALLRALLALGYDCMAAHFNFNLRGSESLRDENFVRSLCNQLDVKLYYKQSDTITYASDRKISVEMAARELRYEFFGQVAAEVGAPIAVAHHRDDNVETLVLNLLRGTGLKGLCGMRYMAKRENSDGVSYRLIRPMLDVTRSDILAYLASIGQKFVNDSTNFVDDVKRNKVRLDVMPVMRSVVPSADDVLARDILKFSEAYKLYRQKVDECLANVHVNAYGDEVLMRKSLDDCASKESVLFEWLSSKGFNETQIFQACAPSMSPRRMEAEEYLLLDDGARWLLISKANLNMRSVELRIGDNVDTPWFSIEAQDNVEMPSAKELRNPSCAYLNADAVQGALVARPLKEGDRFVPYGMNGSKLLSDFLCDSKISIEARMRQYVVCDDVGIVWVVGMRIDNRVRISRSTGNVLRLRILPFDKNDNDRR